MNTRAENLVNKLLDKDISIIETISKNRLEELAFEFIEHGGQVDVKEFTLWLENNNYL